MFVIWFISGWVYFQPIARKASARAAANATSFKGAFRLAGR